MTKYCRNCGTVLSETATVCSECSTPVPNMNTIDITRTKTNTTPATLNLNLFNGILVMLYITIWISSIMQAWVDEEYLYFWIGNDQYLNYFLIVAIVVLSISGLVISTKDHRNGKITDGQKLLAVFFFVNMFFMIYLAFQALMWQF